MKVVNSNRFYLKGTKNRFIHLASVFHNTREFMAFADCLTNKIYVEEVSGGSLQFIFDDALAKELTDFLTYKGLLLMDRPLLSDDRWLRNKNPR